MKQLVSHTNARPVVVAMAAPVNPKAGIGPSPLMNIGHKMILQILASHRLLIAMVALPALLFLFDEK